MGTIKEVVDIWMAVRPFRRWKEHREKRMAEKATITLADGTTHERVEPAIPLRTSTKAGIVGLLVPVLGVVPFYDQINTMLLQTCQSDSGPTVFLGGAAVAWVSAVVTAR